MAGLPLPRRALRDASEHAYRIAMFHSPWIFDDLAKDIDLGLAGHTHGGQVRVPFLPPLWLPEGSGRFVAGWYTTGSAHLFVSRGVGTSIIDVRFACPPELALITLTPASES